MKEEIAQCEVCESTDDFLTYSTSSTGQIVVHCPSCSNVFTHNK